MSLLSSIKHSRTSQLAVMFAVLAICMVNMPLFRLLYIHEGDLAVVWSIVRFSPHQFVYLLCLFPFGLIFLILGLLRLNQLAESNIELDKEIKRGLIVWVALSVVLGGLTLIPSETNKVNDIYKLDQKHSLIMATLAESTIKDVSNFNNSALLAKSNVALKQLVLDCCQGSIDINEDNTSLSKVIFIEVFKELKRQYLANQEKNTETINKFMTEAESLNQEQLKERLNTTSIEDKLLLMTALYEKALPEKYNDKHMPLFGSIEFMFSVSSILFILFVSSWFLFRRDKFGIAFFMQENRKQPFMLFYSALCFVFLWAICRIYSIQLASSIDLLGSKSYADVAIALIFTIFATSYLLKFYYDNNLMSNVVKTVPAFISAIFVVLSYSKPELLNNIVGYESQPITFMFILGLIVCMVIWLLVVLKDTGEE